MIVKLQVDRNLVLCETDYKAAGDEYRRVFEKLMAVVVEHMRFRLGLDKPQKEGAAK